MNSDSNLAAATAAGGLVAEIISTFGMVRLRVLGGIRMPAILPGDFISLLRADFREISAGEVVLFIQHGRLLVHRVVERADGLAKSYLMTRGGRQPHSDPPVFPADLLGCVISVEGRNRKVESGAQPRAWKCTMDPVLQASDRASHLYLHLAEGWQTLFRKRAQCLE